MKTMMLNEATAVHQWYLVDATDKILGRLASALAKRLRGKHKACFTPHVDTGDFIVVVNADKIRLTGAKSDKKVYRHHTGYPGGLKEETFMSLQGRAPIRILELAVKGMLPKNVLGRKMFLKLKIYQGADHPHQAQCPKPINIVEDSK